MLGNGLDHGVGLGVGCDGRTLWLAVGSLDERRGRAAAANRARIKYINSKIIEPRVDEYCSSNLYGYEGRVVKIGV